MRRKYFNKIILILLVLGIMAIYGYSYSKNNLKKISPNDTENTLENDNAEEPTDNNMISFATEKQSNQVLSLQQQYNNPDIQAIISIDNSNFKYPVAQTTNNDYYLTHNYFKEPVSLGAVYADYRVNLESGRKILIFGHSSTKTTAPFNDLEKYYEESFYQTHKYITLETKTNKYHYEIFSIYVETNDFTYMNVVFETQEDWLLHILKLQKKSIYNINMTLKESDDILIMQTCSNDPKYKNDANKYLLIISRRINNE